MYSLTHRDYMQLTPVRFKPIFDRKIWGGRRLASLLNTSFDHDQPVGESIHVVDRPNDGRVSVIAGGPHDGKTLREYMHAAPDQVLGEDTSPDTFGRFPLMLKFLNTEERLSLQVHPGDEYANVNEDDEGKLEAWYVLEADDDAHVIRGLLPDVSPDDLVESIREGHPLDVLNCISVSEGDVILLPPGTVHSIGGGVLLCEIEQNSDVTYRIHDWGRLTPDGSSRDLHLDRALDVIDFKAMGRARARPKEIEGPWKQRDMLVRTPRFTLEKLVIEDRIDEEHPEDTFHLLTCLRGSGTLHTDSGGGEPSRYETGDCVLMPAAFNEYRVEPEGETTLLKVTPARM